MDKLFIRKPIVHGLLWLSFYLVLCCVVKTLSLIIRADYYNLLCIPSFFIVGLLFIYIKEYNLATLINLCIVHERRPLKMLFYLPLFFLAISPLYGGVNIFLQGSYFVISFSVVVSMSFFISIVFHGFLFSCMENKGNHIRVLIVLTFGYAIINTICFIKPNTDFNFILLFFVNYLILGFLFFLIMVSSKNLIICIVTQCFYSFFLAISNTNVISELIIITGVISLIYFAYLILRLRDVLIYFAYPRKK